MFDSLTELPKKSSYFLTEGINQIIQDYIKSNNRVGYTDIHLEIDFYSDQFLKIKKEHNIETAIFTFYEQIDKVLKEKEESTEKRYKPSCTKGCSSCCKMYVTCTVDEAYSVIEYAKEQNVRIDWDTVKKQTKGTVDNWNKFNSKVRSCVFLSKDGTCKVYKFRPAVCRTYSTFGDPKFCNIKKYPKHKVKQNYSPKAELYLGGMWNAQNEILGMPAALLKAKEGDFS